MSFFVTKTLLAVLFVAAGLTAALSMLTLMGKSERKMSVAALRNTHRAAGYAFVLLLVVLAIMGLSYLSAAGDALPLRGVLHWSTAALLVFILALKLVIVRWFKQFMKLVPAMGMMVITLALVVATLSAVFFIVTGGLVGGGTVADTMETDTHAETGAGETTEAVEPRDAGTPPAALPEDDAGETTASGTAPPAAARADADAGAGREVFERSCAGCHYSDSSDRKIGPGLAGLFERDQIESSGLPMTPENVREQILAPAGGMPAFKGLLSEEQLDDLIAFMQGL